MVIAVWKTLDWKLVRGWHSDATSWQDIYVCCIPICNDSGPKPYQCLLQAPLQPGLWCNGISLCAIYNPPAAPGQREGGKEQETDNNGAVNFLDAFCFFIFLLILYTIFHFDYRMLASDVRGGCELSTSFVC